MNRFRIAMTLVEATKVALVGGMAYATQVPGFQLPIEWAIGGTVAALFLGVVSAQMPSWQASPAVSAAATVAEKP